MAVETGLAAASLLGMVAGIAGTLRRGGWPWRTLLVICSLVWPFPRHPLEGPVLIVLSAKYGLGVHVADLLSLLGLAVAVGRPRISETGSPANRSGRQP
jgi:ABC-type dipeptide/oligopeptide/nickel transport system permease component